MPHREHSPFHIIIGFRKLSGLHHAAHATHSGSTHRHIGFFFLLVADDTFGSQEHTGNRSGILQSHTSHLGRVDDTAGFHVLVFVLTGIVTEVAFSLAYFLNNHRTFQTCILHNLTKRLFDGTFYDIDTCGFVCIGTLQAFQSLDGTDVCHTATRDDTFLDSCTRCAQSVVHTVFLLISTSLGAPT